MKDKIVRVLNELMRKNAFIDSVCSIYINKCVYTSSVGEKIAEFNKPAHVNIVLNKKNVNDLVLENKINDFVIRINISTTGEYLGTIDNEHDEIIEEARVDEYYIISGDKDFENVILVDYLWVSNGTVFDMAENCKYQTENGKQLVLRNTFTYDSLPTAFTYLMKLKSLLFKQNRERIAVLDLLCKCSK